MKPTSLDVEHASTLADCLYAIREKASGLISLTEVVNKDMLDVFEQTASVQGAVQSGSAEMSDLLYVSPAQRRRVMYFIGEAEGKSSDLQKTVEMAHDYSFDLWKEKQAEFAAVDTASLELEALIADWQAAYDKWCERRRLGDDSGGPESKAEDIAAEALLEFQCRTSVDVQRKVSLFAGNDHLASLGSNHSDLFLPSLITQPPTAEH